MHLWLTLNILNMGIAKIRRYNTQSRYLRN